MPRLRLATLAGLSFALAATAFGQPAPTNVRVQQIVRDVVAESKRAVIGLGSWITGSGYGDVLANGASDHDLRVLGQGLSPLEARSAWLDTRSKIAQAVRKEFGKDAEKVLATINVYPPPQLMTGVEDAAEASARFRQLGGVPNLGYNGPVQSAPSKFTEGLYGAGAKSWTQEYERTKGRLFFEKNGKGLTGATDFTHLYEGIPRPSIEGSCNTATQWADHLAEELSAGRGDKVAKYLERLDRDLAKARDLAGIAPDPAWRARAKEIFKILKDEPGRLGEFRGEVTAMMRRSKAETAIISRIGRGTSALSRVLTNAMEQLRKSPRLQSILDRASETVTLDNAMRAIAVILQTRQTARYAGEEQYHQAVASALSGIAGLSSLPASLIIELTSWTLETARANGYSFVASTQDAWNLMEGIYSGVGRADVDAKRAYTLDQLVAHIDEEARLSAVVYAKAMLATRRDIGQDTERDDRGAGEAMFARCYPVILAAWRARREELAAEYFGIMDALEGTPVLMSYAPNPVRLAGARVRVTVTADIADRTFDRKMERAKQILVILCRQNVFADFHWIWTGGNEGGSPNQRVYEYTTVGKFPVPAIMRVSAGANNATGTRLTRHFDSHAEVDVVVEREKKAPTVAAKPSAPTPAPAPSGRLYARMRINVYGKWDGSHEKDWVWDREKWWGKDFTIPVKELHHSFEFQGNGEWPVYNTVIRISMQVDPMKSAQLRIVADEKRGPGVVEHFEFEFKDIPWRSGDEQYSLEGATMVEAGNGRANRYAPNPEMRAKSKVQQSITFKDGVTLRLAGVDFERTERVMGPLSSTNFVIITFYREQ